MGANQLSSMIAVLSGFMEIYPIKGTGGWLALQSWAGGYSTNRRFFSSWVQVGFIRKLFKAES